MKAEELKKAPYTYKQVSNFLKPQVPPPKKKLGLFSFLFFGKAIPVCAAGRDGGQDKRGEIKFSKKAYTRRAFPRAWMLFPPSSHLMYTMLVYAWGVKLVVGIPWCNSLMFAVELHSPII